MKRAIACSLIVSFLVAGCGGSKSGTDAIVVAVAAATMKAAQMIQEERRKNRGETYECTKYCTYNEVPCGDDCVPYGSICYAAPKHACYGGDPSGPEEPLPRQEINPDAQQDVGIVFSPVY